MVTIEHEPLSIEFSIAKLECKSGDTVLFKVKCLDQALATVPQRVAAFEAHLQTFLPKGVKALLIDSDMDVSVISDSTSVRIDEDAVTITSDTIGGIS